MPGLTPRPCGAAQSAVMGASWPWCESGEPIFDGDEAVERLEEGTRRSDSSGYMPGEDRPALYMYGGSAAYTVVPSYAIVVEYASRGSCCA